MNECTKNKQSVRMWTVKTFELASKNYEYYLINGTQNATWGEGLSKILDKFIVVPSQIWCIP